MEEDESKLLLVQISLDEQKQDKMNYTVIIARVEQPLHLEIKNSRWRILRVGHYILNIQIV